MRFELTAERLAEEAFEITKGPAIVAFNKEVKARILSMAVDNGAQDLETALKWIGIFQTAFELGFRTGRAEGLGEAHAAEAADEIAALRRMAEAE